MCGLFGFSRTTDLTQRMTGVLAIMMEERGAQSWGVTDGLKLHKHVGPITQGFINYNLEAPTYHTRAASVGTISERNAHPFEFLSPTRRVVGVHNGHISNHAELKARYHATRHACEVDSEQIFAQIAEGKPLSELRGWGTVIWYEGPRASTRVGNRYLSTFSRGDLAIARLKSGECVFASTSESISAAARLCGGEVKTFYEVKPKHKYHFQATSKGDDLMVDAALMTWDAPSTVHYINSSVNVGTEFRRTPSTGGCIILSCHSGKKAGADLICVDCLKQADNATNYKGIAVC